MVSIAIHQGFHTKIPHFFEIWPNIPIYLMFAVQISIPYQYTSFWGSGIPIYLMFSENSSNIPIYRMHDLGAQKGHTNIPGTILYWAIVHRVTGTWESRVTGTWESHILRPFRSCSSRTLRQFISMQMRAFCQIGKSQ